jgi:hypothetical protein
MNSTAIIPSSGAVLDAEWSVLLAACSPLLPREKFSHIDLLLKKPVRWDLLHELAEQHGTAPLLYRALSGLGDAIPGEELHRLKRRYETNLHKALFLARELIRILDCMAPLGIEVMPYKGVVLAEAIYGDMALRQAGDIDLLIRARDLPRIKSAVRELGYRPHQPLSDAEERAYLTSGYECVFDSPAGRNLLELQWAVQPYFYAVDLNVESLFQQAATATLAGRNVKTLSPENLLLVLSMHAAKHAWGRLIWLCDITCLMTLTGLNWDWIANQATALGIVRILRVTLLLAHRMLGTTMPDSLDAKLPEDFEASDLASTIQGRIVGGVRCDTESIDYFRLMAHLRERQSDRMRFLQRLIFTPGPGEWKAVRLPAPLFPLYRLVRLSRLAARLARA